MTKKDVFYTTEMAPKMAKQLIAIICYISLTVCLPLHAAPSTSNGNAANPDPEFPLINSEDKTKVQTLEKNQANVINNSYVEAGVERYPVTNGYGNWFNQYFKIFAQVDEKNAWYGEFYHDYEFFQHGDYAKVEQTHIFNEDYYTTVSAGLSDNSIFIPKYYVGGTLFNKQLKRKQLVFYLGVHAYWWRPDSSTEDINPGFVYYFEGPWVFEGGLYVNRSNPGVVYSASGYAALTEGREREHYITLRVGIGREAYLPLGGNVAVVGYPSQVVTVTWRQWIGNDWGTNIVAEGYHNRFYDRSGFSIGLFKDFAL